MNMNVLAANTATPEAVDPQLALWGVIGICVVVVVGLIAFTVIAVVLLRERPVEVSESLDIILSSERALQLVTVSAIIIVLLFLGIAGRLNDGAIGILGSVGGYVLGNLSKGTRKESKPTKVEIR
jgi:hypothetical protein